MDLIEDLDTRGIKPGDFVIRKAHGAEPMETFSAQPGAEIAPTVDFSDSATPAAAPANDNSGMQQPRTGTQN